MTTSIALTAQEIENLDLSPVQEIVKNILQQQSLAAYEEQLYFDINYPREETDPRELSEIPEIRLWFIRLDAVYPWFPLLLDRKSGELARYTAMLIPHQFSRSQGIEFNPEALEIFMMQKIFAISDWLKTQQIPFKFRLKAISQTLGYDIDDSFFDGLA